MNLELLPYKPAVSAFAIVVTFLLFVPYLRAIWRSEIQPHVFSWVVWALGTFVVFCAQLVGGAGFGAWPIGVSACITGFVAFEAYRRRADTGITRFDWVLFCLAIAALPIWFFTSDPMWAVVLLTAADLLGFGPTLRRAYAKPFEEHAGFFALGAIRNALVVYALEAYSVTTSLFPLAVGLACLFVAAFLLVRRRVLV